MHTNLGRAPLSAAAVEALSVAAGATDVELDLDTGRRGRRGRSAMAALAAAVPDAGRRARGEQRCGRARPGHLCPRRKVARSSWPGASWSRSGTASGIPELLESLGARLREVGTTNRVRLSDYADAIGDQTAFVLKVHPSNFVVSGFTSSVGIRGAGLAAHDPWSRTSAPVCSPRTRGCPTSRVLPRPCAPAPTSSRRPGTSCSVALSAG